MMEEDIKIDEFLKLVAEAKELGAETVRIVVMTETYSCVSHDSYVVGEIQNDGTVLEIHTA